jgi:hypothetical protein
MVSFIQNGGLKDSVSKVTGLNNPEKISGAIADYFIPSLLSNDGVFYSQSGIAKSADQSGGGTATLYTTPTNEDFYLTGFTHTFTKSTTQTSVESDIQVTIGGATVTISHLQATGATQAHSQFEACLSFYYPLKLDRGSQINLVQSAGTGDSNAFISGMVV